MTHATVETAAGPARLHVHGAADGSPPVGTVVLTHGSAGGVHAPDLRHLRDAAVGLGCVVVAVEQPFRVAGRRAPGNPDVQDAAWVEIVAGLGRPGPLVLAGRSNGARVACRTATTLGAAGVIALAFPVHPPGRPDRDRLAELAAPRCPVLVVQGERDPFGVPARRRGRRVALAPGDDHSLRRSTGLVVTESRRFLRRLLGPLAPRPGAVAPG